MVLKTSSVSTTEHPSSIDSSTLQGTDNTVGHTTNNVDVTYEQTIAGPTSHKFCLVTSDCSVDTDDEESADSTSHKTTMGRTTDNGNGQKNGEPLVETSSIGKCNDDDEDKKLSETTTDHPSSCQNNMQQDTYDSENEQNMQQGTDDAENKEQNAGTTTRPALDETKAASVSFKERMEVTIPSEISIDNGAEGADDRDMSRGRKTDEGGSKLDAGGDQSGSTSGRNGNTLLDLLKREINDDKRKEGINKDTSYKTSGRKPGDSGSKLDAGGDQSGSTSGRNDPKRKQDVNNWFRSLRRSLNSSKHNLSVPWKQGSHSSARWLSSSIKSDNVPGSSSKAVCSEDNRGRSWRFPSTKSKLGNQN